MPGRTNREDDELTLEWIEMRARGVSPREIAERYGVPSERARTVTNRILKVDKAEAGESIRGHYW
jgi:hypothetical protein